MPLQVQLLTRHFVDEGGVEIPDATFTLRTRISHAARNAYMNSVSEKIPDLPDNIEDGKLKKGYSPRGGMGMIDSIEKILLKDGLVGLTGVFDEKNQEIKTWEEFLNFDSFYVSQVTKILQENALSSIRKSTPSPNE